MKFSKTYTLTSQVYLDNFCQNYKNIIIINDIPEGPLRYFVRRIQLPRLSPFQYENSSRYLPKCGLALTTFRNRYIDCANNRLVDRNNDCFMTPNEIPDLFLFLSENGYWIVACHDYQSWFCQYEFCFSDSYL